jgi:hypothetical protein
MDDTLYNVIGGEYADTSFTKLADGATTERFGPMPRSAAMVLWRSLSAKSVDNCMVRYYVRAVDEAVTERWFVAGGEYADTTFHQIVPGGKLEVYGPYDDRQQALAVWRAITGKTVDDAHQRYDIVSEARLEALKKQSAPNS